MATETATEIDFDEPIEREDTDCEKYDGRQRVFGRADVIPLWVADMDFAAPACVREALTARVRHPIYGYSQPGDRLVEALHSWFARRHQWDIDPADVVWSPGTVPALVASILALTERGDKVLVPTPVYPPFLKSVTQNGRELVTSTLLASGEGYQLNFEQIENQAAAGAKLLLLCSPHNPVGRVWTARELDRLIDTALRHNMVVVSDDVHADFVYPGNKYVPLALRAPAELRLVTTLSPAKTFNIPGIGLTAVVVSHSADRKAIGAVFDRIHLNPFNPLTMAAVEAAYSRGDAWLDALLAYLDENRRWLHAEIAALDGLKSQLPEATFLTWVDCRELGLTDGELSEFLVEKAGLGVNAGPLFGPGGRGHIRLNFGTQRAVLRTALGQLTAAFDQYL